MPALTAMHNRGLYLSIILAHVVAVKMLAALIIENANDIEAIEYHIIVNWQYKLSD